MIDWLTSSALFHPIISEALISDFQCQLSWLAGQFSQRLVSMDSMDGLLFTVRAFLSKLDDFPVLSSSTSCHCQCHAGALKKLRGNVRANKLLPARNPQLDKIAQIGLTWGSEQIYQQNDSIPKETRPVKYPTRGEVVIPMNLNIWYFWKSPFCVWTGDEVSANTGFNWLENEVCLYLQ